MNKALIIAEHHNGMIAPATLAAVTASKQLNAETHVLIAGLKIKAIAQALQSIQGVHTILVADNKVYEHSPVENIATLCKTLAKDYQYVIASANTFGKNILPYLAGLLDVDMVSDVIKIIDANTYIRPIYAGNAQEKVQLNESIQCLTIRPTAFDEASAGDTKANINMCDTVCDLKRTTFVCLTQEEKIRPDLTAAKIIVAGGRALGSKENFKIIEALADTLNAAVGATRAAVDAGYIGNEFQVGQTGKVVAPDLYIAIGISGAIQHLAGMKDSKIIVAINQDKDAPIFQVADYGIVGDLFELVPELTTALKG